MRQIVPSLHALLEIAGTCQNCKLSVSALVKRSFLQLSTEVSQVHLQQRKCKLWPDGGKKTPVPSPCCSHMSIKRGDRRRRPEIARSIQAKKPASAAVNSPLSSDVCAVVWVFVCTLTRILASLYFVSSPPFYLNKSHQIEASGVTI